MYSVMLSYNFVSQRLTHRFKENAEGTVCLQAVLNCANHQVFDVSSCYKFFFFFLDFANLILLGSTFGAFHEANTNERC